MTDRRLLRANGRVAHSSLKGLVDAERFVDGEAMAIGVAVTAICNAPDGSRDRELVTGEPFRVLEMPDQEQNGWAFGFAERDGYCGYVKASLLHPVQTATHKVAVRETYRKETADLKQFEPTFPLYFGSAVTVVEEVGDWSGVDGMPGCPGSGHTSQYYLPTVHLLPMNVVESDPVAVARRFLGTPYLWGGNSGRGIDCSGLIQVAMLACGWACPGDSDLQQAMPGTRLTDDMPLMPGDLIFWTGHVAMVTGPDMLIHANAHHMSVVEEPMAEAVQRIAATDTALITSRLRPRRIR